MTQTWSWVLGIIGVTALVCIGRLRWWGWWLAFTNECLWVIYAVVTRQWGFIFAALCYGSVNFYHGRKWRQYAKANKMEVSGMRSDSHHVREGVGPTGV